MQAIPEHQKTPNLDELVAVLTDEIVNTPQEVFRRCQTLEQLSAAGTTVIEALPAILRSLVVPVSVDCVLALRIAAAEAAWKVGGRHDLALPFLAWGLKDEYWGVSRKAVEILSEMETVGHDAIPDLVDLAKRRLDHGPFHYEEFGDANNADPLLAVIATALGSCGRGVRHVDAARRILVRIIDCEDRVTCTAAQQAVEQLQNMPT